MGDPPDHAGPNLQFDDAGMSRSVTHWEFVGGTIYCSVKGGRLKLGADHRYGRSFTCPHCHTFVSGRLEAGA